MERPSPPRPWPYRVKLFADGADLPGMLRSAADPRVRGFTTNPTLMRKAGVADYREFGRRALEAIPDRPISFEVFADEPEAMRRQARELATWGPNVYVKIPVTNTSRRSTAEIVRDLAGDGVQINVTAVFSLRQVAEIAAALAGGAPSVVSVFAGRIADAGVDPVPHMVAARALLRAVAPSAELLWASPREVLNIVQADFTGCDIITVTSDLIAKIDGLGRDLEDFSLDTVKMFKNDAEAAGYAL